MKYKGIEIEEVTEPQLFDPPKKMLVWDDCSDIVELDVYAIVSREDFRVICGSSTWRHCAKIPEVTVTYRELSRWLAEGNGEVRLSQSAACANWNYSIGNENKFLYEDFYVRRWDETEWHKPTREYLGLEDR